MCQEQDNCSEIYAHSVLWVNAHLDFFVLLYWLQDIILNSQQKKKRLST